MAKTTKEKRQQMITKQQALDNAAVSLALAARIHGVAVHDIVDLIRAQACLKIKEMRKNAAQEILDNMETKTQGVCAPIIYTPSNNENIEP